MASTQDTMPEKMKASLPSPIEYTVFNEVSIVHNTKLKFDEFWAQLESLEAKNSSNLPLDGRWHKRAVVREALAQYAWPKIVIDPIKPGNENLYDAHYEHVKQVFGHKFVKDFIIRAGKEHFSKEDIESWFKPMPVQDKVNFKQPQVPAEKCNLLLDYLNSLIIHQMNYILDTIQKYSLDFYNANDAPETAKNFDKERRFPLWYREYIHKTWHGIEEKAFYLFKYAYEHDRRYAFERIEWFDDFSDFLPITNV